MMNDDDDDNDDDDEVRVVPNVGECTVRPVTTSLLSPISSQPPPLPQVIIAEYLKYDQMSFLGIGGT